MLSSKLIIRKSGRSIFTLVAVFGILLIVGLACGGNKPAPAKYVGFWTGTDGTTITIRADGSADYKSGNSSISGGGVVIDESAKTMKITFASLGPTFKIDKEPDNDQMTLDGIVFKRSDGSTNSPDNAKAEIPSDDKLQSLVKATFLDFGDSVQAGDFSDFHKKVAKVWRDSSSTEELDKAFKVFIDHKENYNFKKAVSPLEATFSPAPAIEKVAGLDALVVTGYYPTKPEKTNFVLKYAMDDGVWKLISIDIKTTN